MKSLLKILVGLVPVSLIILFAIGLGTDNTYAIIFMGAISIVLLLVSSWCFGDSIIYAMTKGRKR